MIDFLRTALSEIPKALAAAILVLIVLLLGAVDLATGPEMGLSIFYLGPVALATWFLGNRTGAALAFFCALTWLAANLASGPTYSHPLTPYWNSSVRLAFFLLTVFLLAQIKAREVRRRLLERIFFHDILNVATGIRGYAELLLNDRVENPRELYGDIHTAAGQVVDEIEAQRTLTAAEAHELRPQALPIDSRRLLERAVEMYRHHNVAQGRTLTLAPESESFLFESDESLLLRILGNMLKNALEAVPQGETVTAGCRRVGKTVEFWVHNPQYIQRRDQMRIFQQSFSTKGRDRGLGTYSMKVLSELLKADVSFVTSEQEGTTFRLRCPLPSSRIDRSGP